MAKLYPPYIEGKLPTQIGDTLSIPYSPNRAVGAEDYAGFSLLIKTIATDKEIDSIESDNDTTAIFNISDLTLVNGQYYKAQLAYIAADNNKTIGYYSTVGVFKYLKEKPKVTVSPVSERNTYAGSYETTDPTEKVYYYRFVLSESAGIIDDTGWCLHDSATDSSSTTSTDTYNCNMELESFIPYSLQYQVKTSSGLELVSASLSIDPKLNGIAFPNYIKLAVTKNQDEGYNSVYLQYDLPQDSKLNRLQGTFKLFRTAEVKTGVKKWMTIGTFTINQPKNNLSEYILLSSSAVYPETLNLPFKESDEVGKNIFWKDYGINKIEAEKYLLENFERTYILRPPYLYGPENNVYRESFIFDCAEQNRKFYLPENNGMKLQFFLYRRFM